MAVSEMGAEQKPTELATLITALDGRPLRRVLEIGVFQGGTFWLWRQLAGPKGQVIGVDLREPRCRPCDEGRAHSSCPRARLRELGEMVFGDSHEKATRRQVEKLLAGEKVDLLHVDGDHEDPGVAKDVDLYAPFLRRGGVMVFHDVASDAYPAVKAFWRAIRAANPHALEFVSEPKDWGGIGLVPF